MPWLIISALIFNYQAEQAECLIRMNTNNNYFIFFYACIVIYSN